MKVPVALAISSSVAMASGSNTIYSYKCSLVRGVLVERYKRFLADIDFGSGGDSGPTASSPATSRHFKQSAQQQQQQRTLTTIYVPNTGSMYSLLNPHNPNPVVYCSVATGESAAKRKYANTLEIVQLATTSGRFVWVGIHSALANKMVESALSLGLIEEMRGFSDLQREVAVQIGTEEESRIDFRLLWGSGVGKYGSGGKRKRERENLGSSNEEAVERSVLLEVKSVTLAVGSTAQFPDWHLRALMDHVTTGGEAAVLFLVQRDDCDSFSGSTEFDPEYTRLLHEAALKGVQILPYACRLLVEEGRVDLIGRLRFVDTYETV